MGCFGQRQRSSEKKQNPYQSPAGGPYPTLKAHGGGDKKSKRKHGDAAERADAYVEAAGTFGEACASFIQACCACSNDGGDGGNGGD